MSRTLPRTFLLHMPLTDLQRRIYRLADSCSGTLESPAGRFFDPSAVGSMTTARPPLSLLLCPSISCLCPDCLSPRCLHSTAVVRSIEPFAHAERSGLITHQRFRLGSEVKKILQATPPKLRREMGMCATTIYIPGTYSSSSIIRYEYSLYVLQSRASRSRCSTPCISGRVDMLTSPVPTARAAVATEACVESKHDMYLIHIYV